MGSRVTFIGTDNGEYKYEIEVTYPTTTDYQAMLQNGSTTLSINSGHGCDCPDTSDESDPEATPPVPVEEEIVDTTVVEDPPCRPSTLCLHGLAVELNPVGMAPVSADLLVLSPDELCETTEISLWHQPLLDGTPSANPQGVGLSQSILFTCDHLRTQLVEVHFQEAQGGSNFCQTYVNVQDNNQVCTENSTATLPATMARIAGQVHSWKEEAVEAVEVSLQTDAYQTPSNGFYHFDVPMEQAYTITPSKLMNPLNGVSTFDLVLMSKHILGIQKFDSPYQLVAADINRSKTVTTFDIVLLRRLILAIDTEFTNNTSWRFIPSDYSFQTDQPLAENFEEYYHIDHLTTNHLVDFVGVKIGDVNGNARPNSLVRSEVRNSKDKLTIDVQDQVLKAGQLYEVTFSTAQLAQIQGYQFTLDVEQARIDKVQGDLLQLENFGLQNLDRGQLTLSWNQSTADGKAGTINESTDLFTIQLLALQDALLSEVLSITDQPTSIEAYDTQGEVMDIQFNFQSNPVLAVFELYQNEPNPFYQTTTIPYILPADGKATLVLRDEAGRVVDILHQEGKAGKNQFQLQESALPKGFIYYQLITKFGDKSRKMLRLH